MLLIVAVSGRADGWSPESVGLRYGMSATSLDDLYWQLEPDVRWHLPLDVALGRGWDLEFEASVTAGWIASRGDHGFIGSLGPLASFAKLGLPLRFQGGLSPTLMDRYKFGQDDFGSYLQFTTHAGFLWDLGCHWSVGYRWQHMSNGGWNQPNPGVNMHTLQCFFRF